MVGNHDDLGACDTEVGLNLKRNMWSFFSFAFVSSMRQRNQEMVVALVHKELDGERALDESILFQYELPTIGIGAWGLGHWSPQVLLIDLLGTCKQTSPRLQKQLYSALPGFYKSLVKEYQWTQEDFSFRSRVSWTCLDCPQSNCRLDEELAKQARGLLEAGPSFFFCFNS